MTPVGSGVVVGGYTLETVCVIISKSTGHDGHACSHSTQDAKSGLLQVQSQIGLYSVLKNKHKTKNTNSTEDRKLRGSLKMMNDLLHNFQVVFIIP